MFTSETDAEVIAHLVAHLYDGDLVAAVRAAYGGCAATTRSSR